MSYIFIFVNHNWHFYVFKLMISVGNLSILSDFLTHFMPRCSTAVSMATAMQMDERMKGSLITWFWVPITKIGKFQQN